MREVERQLGVTGDRVSICPPGAPAWTPRPAAAPHGYLLFVGTLEPRKNIGTLLDASGLPEVFVGLVPTKVSWQAAIYLHFGGFNDCPQPDEIGSVLRHWQGTHGAELICMKGDVLEMRVARPPTKREFGYQFDRLERGQSRRFG